MGEGEGETARAEEEVGIGNVYSGEQKLLLGEVRLLL
jgi:hypothetical protein